MRRDAARRSEATPFRADRLWRRAARIVALAFGAGALALGAPAPTAVAAPLSGIAPADVSDFTFDSFDAEYTLSRAADGTSELAVVETIVARFPDIDQNRGIIRAIPDDYDGVPLDTVVESVVDETGAAVPYEEERGDGFVELALGDDSFVRGPTTYVVSYRQSDVVRHFDDTDSDEFYWDVNGTGWEQPFGRVSAVVAIDAALAESLSGNEACYQGAYGETGSCTITRETGPAGATLLRAEAQDLAGGENLSIAIGFASGTFETVAPPVSTPRTPQPVPLGAHLIGGGLIAAALALLGGSIWSRVRAPRDARGRGIVVPQYTEPDGISIAQAAHLVGRGESALPAAIVRLAVRRNLRILGYKAKGFDESYALQYLTSKGTEGETASARFDRALLGALFGPDPQPETVVGFDESRTDLMDGLRTLAGEQKRSLIPDGLQRQRTTGALAVIAPIGLGILVFVSFSAVGLSFVTFGSASPLFFVALGVALVGLIASFALAFRGPTYTQEGALAREHLFGMRDYLELAERDRFRMLQSPQGAERIDVSDEFQLVKLYERLLPWAVLWGVEKEWARELAVHAETAGAQPDWFLGPRGFESALLVSTMSGMRTAVAPPVSTSWSGSGGGSTFSGGSFGGGFSGGGGGGGGGGGR